MRLSQCIATHDKYFDNTIVNFDSSVTLLCGPARSGKSYLMNSIFRAIFNASEKTETSEDSLVLNITFDSGSSQFRVLHDSTKTNFVRLIGSDEFNTDGFKVEQIFASSYVYSPADHHLQTDIIDFETLIPLYLHDKEHYYYKGGILGTLMCDQTRFGKIQFAKRESAYMAERSRLLKELEIRGIKDGKRDKLQLEKDQLTVEVSGLAEKRVSIIDSIRQLNSLREMVSEYNEMKSQRLVLFAQKEEENEKDQTVRNLKRELKKQFPRFHGISADLRESISRINSLYGKMTKTAEKADSFRVKSAKGVRAAITVLLFTVGVISAFFVFNHLYGLIQFLYALIASSSAAFVAMIFTAARIHHLHKIFSTDLLNEDKARLEDEISAELAKNNISIKDVRGKEIYNFVVHYLNEYGYFCEREDNIRDKCNELDALLERRTDEQIEELNSRIEAFAGSIRDFSLKIGFEGVNPDNFDYEEYHNELEKKLKDADQESARLESIIIRLDEEINDFTPSAPDRTDDRLAHVEEQITQAKLSIKSLVYIHETIRDIIEKESIRFRQNLAEQILKNLNALGVNESLERILTVLGGNPVYDNPSLKQLFLISLKISLGECCDTVNFPLVFDEPAVFMDKKTVVLFCDLIKNICMNRQVIILTHDPDQFSFNNRVVLR